MQEVVDRQRGRVRGQPGGGTHREHFFVKQENRRAVFPFSIAEAHGDVDVLSVHVRIVDLGDQAQLQLGLRQAQCSQPGQDAQV
ncbi:hypothetical protein D3C84_762740 [compost metagenome]